MTLEEYFKLIVKPTEKEPTMFDIFKTTTEALKAKWSELTTTRYEFKEEPVQMMGEDYWAFEMYTGEWIDEYGETVPVKHTVIIEPHDGSWTEVLDKVMDEMEKHYGYSIKEQVYYSVNFPLNILDSGGTPLAGYGRCLNDERLQQLLLAFPELYEHRPWSSNPNQDGDMFK